MYLTNAQKLELESHYGVVLTRGKDMNGQVFYAYILADKDAIDRMNRDFEEKKSNVNFAGYGRILAYGPGENPPEEVARQVMEKYGVK